MEDKRKEFMQDLHHLLETHKRFIDDTEYSDDQGDSWDFVLDDCQNIYVKWIYNNAKDVRMMNCFEGVDPPSWECTEENQEKTEKWIEEQLEIHKKEKNDND